MSNPSYMEMGDELKIHVDALQHELHGLKFGRESISVSDKDVKDIANRVISAEVRDKMTATVETLRRLLEREENITDESESYGNAARLIEYLLKNNTELYLEALE